MAGQSQCGSKYLAAVDGSLHFHILTYMCVYRVFYERHNISIDVAVKLAVKVFDFCGVLWQIIMQRPKEK